MYWADKLVEEIVKSGQYKPYWVDDMKTPSGRVHIGSVRAVVTHELIYRVLQVRGKKATFSYVLEDHDPMDALPTYLDEKKYREHLGKPLYKIPSPEPGFASYGQRWGQEYIEIFNALGVKPKVIWGSQLYLSGKMNALVRLCLDRADKIRAIYKTLYGQKRPENWYPFNVVCENCGKLSTTVVTDWDGQEVTYTCQVDGLDWTKGCGYQGVTSPFDGKGKLPWKVEWPCKWKVIGVTIEGAGKDHMSDGGSHDFAKLMCKNILDYPVPFAFSHEFFLIGGHKMSSSKGVGSSAKEIAELIPPYLVRFLIARVKYNRAINFDPGGMTIPDLFDDYDAAAETYWQDPKRNLARVFELSQVSGKPPKKQFLPRFRDVARFIQHPEIAVAKKFAEVKGSPLSKAEKETLKERSKYAKIWLESQAPEEEVFTPSREIPQQAENLTDLQKKYLLAVVELLDQDWKAPEDLQIALYNKAKEIKLASSKAFGAIYLALIGKTHGPRAAWFLLEHAKVARKRFREIPTGKAKEKPKRSPASQKISGMEYGEISEAIKETFPGVSYAFTVIEDVEIKKSEKDLEKLKKEIINKKKSLDLEEIKEIGPIKTYRRMFKGTGVDTGSRRPSPEALLRRIVQGKGLYNINTAVDAYNLAVIETGIGLGGFDFDRTKPPFSLRFSEEGEEMLLLGDEEVTQTKKGEIIYADLVKPLTLDLNYRDIDETKITLNTKNIILFADGGPGIEPGEVKEALELGAKYIQQFCGGKVRKIILVR